MTFRERRTVASFISTLLIFGIYFYFLLRRYQGETLQLSEELRFWAMATLIFIGIMVVFKIISYIIFTILHAIATREYEKIDTDELEKLIELKATRNAYVVFLAGFILSLVTLILGMPVMVMFSSLIGAFTLAAMSADISQLYFYRKGV
ncbi:MAG: hypothetical protein K9N46_01305 [Candidatus Marinimicrobia bacterium]|nr:hypothetical protein [Candidatus Neomarinimicrobiota bacterium]MCF7827887.1 hypothetical protein [Candidatus Neomarinimicrobiota bacterium]MCF7879358.1 hypothetical protein [Candidatus Neomarinimicrobiota bacterium]